MKQVQALRGFIHGEPRKRNERFSVTNQTAAELEQKGLVRILSDEGPTEETPSTADVEKSSASPAAPVSPQTIANTSGNGARKRGRPRKHAVSS
jgi:AT hook motif.